AASGSGNVRRRPSPSRLTVRPPRLRTMGPTVRWCRDNSSLAASSPCCWVKRVKPSRSVKATTSDEDTPPSVFASSVDAASAWTRAKPRRDNSVRDIGKLVEARIDELLSDELARGRAIDPLLAAPFEALRGLALAGGKRLRPAFCLAAFIGAGGDADDPAIVDAGAALELLHLF